MLSNNRPKLVLTALSYIIVAVLALGYGIAAGRYKLPPFSLFSAAKQAVEGAQQTPTQPLEQVSLTPQPTVVPAYLENILALVDAHELSSQTAKIDFVREFVFNNSIHQIDEEYVSHNATALEMLYAHSLSGANPPHMDCSSRTSAMIEILESLEIRTRIVHVFSDNFYPQQGFQSHTFIEVYNADHRAWEVQDPDYNVYYLNPQDVARLSAAQLLLIKPASIVVGGTNPEQTQLVEENLLPNYFEAAVYQGWDGRPALGILNTSRLTPQNDSPDPETGYQILLEHLFELYGDFPVLFNQDFE